MKMNGNWMPENHDTILSSRAVVVYVAGLFHSVFIRPRRKLAEHQNKTREFQPNVIPITHDTDCCGSCFTAAEAVLSVRRFFTGKHCTRLSLSALAASSKPNAGGMSE
jgi:hypothetical protein